MWKNMVERGRSQMTIWRMRIACWYLRVQIHTQNMQYLLLFHCNNSCTNAPQCYVLRTLPVSLFKNFFPQIHVSQQSINMCLQASSFTHLFWLFTISTPLLASPIFYFFPNTTCHTRFLSHLVLIFQYSFNKLFSDFYFNIVCLSFSQSLLFLSSYPLLVASAQILVHYYLLQFLFQPLSPTSHTHITFLPYHNFKRSSVTKYIIRCQDFTKQLSLLLFQVPSRQNQWLHNSVAPSISCKMYTIKFFYSFHASLNPQTSIP
jgi:hypothetical protein